MESNICEQTEDELEEQKVNQADQIAYSDMPYDPVEAQQEIMSDELMNAAKGCIIGAFVGDAAGAVLEFKSSIKQVDVEKALTFPGGGVLHVKLNAYSKVEINKINIVISLKIKQHQYS